MSWIAVIPDSDAQSGERKYVASIIKIFSLRPDLLKARVRFQGAITFGGSGLGRRKEELIATSISGLLSCKY